MKSPWACTGVMGWKLTKLVNNSAGSSEEGVKFSPVQLAGVIMCTKLAGVRVGKISV